ncbi:hypothetical protein RN001_015432 [Aquatica leii]|uniref:Zinc carboxypeptidase A 1 n=1 Tax=Aquatica leii TaxID=1421715 RepID=A0AAN7SL69_9COLE|nr:hypothetical protein RN001_015432 [Aquatica leii]
MVTGCCCSSTVSYSNYRVYRVLPKNLSQLNALRNLKNQTYEFWIEPSHPNVYADVMIAPSQVPCFERFLTMFNLENNVMIDNLQDLINQEQNYTIARSSEWNWNSYQTLDQINTWLNSLESKYVGTVTRIIGGQSYEKRNIYGVRVSFKPGNRAVFLEGGIHAREWISPATVTYILNELLTSTNPKIRSVAESRDWYIFPIFNPDGYEYTFKKDRMWRKTRKPNLACFGADLNRNWNYHWMEGGSSYNPCSDTFAGRSAFSEIEAKSLSQFITSISSQLDAYISFHSYSQLLLIPFGHQGLEKPPNNDELHRIGRVAVAKLFERYGTNYTVGNIPDVIYVASGGSMDWVAGLHKVKMAYTFELRDEGRYGFVLPPDQIVPTGQETLDALIVMIEELNALQ